MAKLSAGLLPFRMNNGRLEVFLVHPGGPFWVRKDEGAWSIPKGEYAEDEDPLDAAKREFTEETGLESHGPYLPLGRSKQPSGKWVTAWAIEKDLDADAIKSNLFSMEWPPKSGKMQDFVEVDRAGWFSLSQAREKILKGQAIFIDKLEEALNSGPPT